MLADTNMTPDDLLYNYRFVDCKVNLPWVSVVNLEEEDTTSPIKNSLDESQLNPQSTIKVADCDRMAPNIEGKRQHQPASKSSLIGIFPFCFFVFTITLFFSQCEEFSL